MKKMFFLLGIILLIIGIYFCTKTNKKSYLVLGISDNNIYIQNKKIELDKNNQLKNYNTKFLNEKYRITDVINDIRFQKEIDNKTILNYMIKADYITLNIGYNDFKIILEDENLYINIDNVINDLEELFKLIRIYSKEKVSFLKINVSPKIDDYIESQIQKLCNKYNIEYIM